MSRVGTSGSGLGSRAALIVGAGGLGCPVSLALAEAGVGHLVLHDADTVDASNLHRQVLYSLADVGMPKIEAAAAALALRVPGVRVTGRAERVTTDNVDAVIAASAPDVIVDATDDPDARFVLNDAAFRHGIPTILGGVIRFEGIVIAVDPRSDGPCFRCLFETPPAPDEVPTCASAGVLGAMAGVVGHTQAARALRLLAVAPGEAGYLDWAGYVTTVDGLRGRVRDVRFPRDPGCPACRDVAMSTSQDGNQTVKVQIPTSLRRFSGGEPVVAVTGSSVRAALDSLERAHPGLQAKLRDADGNLRRYINVFANDEDIRFLDHLDTTLHDGARLQIVPAIVGGA